MAMLVDDGHREGTGAGSPAGRGGILVMWDGDRVLLCLGPDTDAVAAEVIDDARRALIRCGVDPASIVVAD